MDKRLESFYNRSLEGYPEHEHVRAFAVALQSAETKIKKLQAYAKLGRMVHKALDNSAGVFSQKLSMGPHNNNRPGYWVSIIASSGERETYHGNTLLDALEAAGIKDE